MRELLAGPWGCAGAGTHKAHSGGMERSGASSPARTGWRAPEHKLAEHRRSVTRLGWLRHCAEGRTENKLQRRGRSVMVSAGWSRARSVHTMAREGSGMGGWTEHRRGSCPNICPELRDAPWVQKGREKNPLWCRDLRHISPLGLLVFG